MSHRSSLSAATAALLAVLAIAAFVAAPAQPAAAATAARPPRIGSHQVCTTASAGMAACDARVVVTTGNRPAAAAAPVGYGPSDLRSAYNLPADGSGTVAIVDAYNDPNAAADLNVYRSTYGLPACTTSSGCFRQVNQSGGTRLPRSNGGWAQEISLDLDMVSAICPGCSILLVEASTASFANLAAAVQYAASQHVTAISNSYGGSDLSGASYPQYENAAASGIAVTASTGDNGYGVESPASFTHVVAVGGTSLVRSGTPRGWSESAWSGAGSGCSSVNPKPSYQTSPTSCADKVSADVSAVADPNTGVAVYDSYSYQGASGWLEFGGTSVASPIIAGVYALAGGAGGGYAGRLPWANTAALYDVTDGSNGSCSPRVLCTSGPGWDGPTGLGTPNGTAAF